MELSALTAEERVCDTAPAFCRRHKKVRRVLCAVWNPCHVIQLCFQLPVTSESSLSAWAWFVGVAHFIPLRDKGVVLSSVVHEWKKIHDHETTFFWHSIHDHLPRSMSKRPSPYLVIPFWRLFSPTYVLQTNHAISTYRGSERPSNGHSGCEAVAINRKSSSS